MNTKENTQNAWAVFFDGDFWGHRGRGKAGEEISLKQTCLWAGHEWMIPAIYSCGKGLVVDICRSISREDMENFARKWHLIDEKGREVEPPEEMLAQIEREHPMNFQYRMEASLDGRRLPSDHGCGITYNPMEMAAPTAMDVDGDTAAIPAMDADGDTTTISVRDVDGDTMTLSAMDAGEESDQELYDPNRDSRPVVEHYGLDPERIWIIQRHSFLWNAEKSSRKPKRLKNLVITMKADPQEWKSQVFEASKTGDCYDFIHPVTQQKHHLQVTAFSPEIVDADRLQMSDLILPDHFYTMEYELTPDIPRNRMRLQDARGGDRPRRKTEQREDHGSMSCGVIIGGSDGPTAIFLAGRGQSNHTATSGLYFEEQKRLHWQMTFLHNEVEDFQWNISSSANLQETHFKNAEIM